MDSSSRSFFPRSTSTVSLNERFSQVLMDKLTQDNTVTLDSNLLQQGTVCNSPSLVLLVQTGTPMLADLQTRNSSGRVKQLLRRRRSVWSRLGWKQVTGRLSASRPRGFWSFRNKYKRRTGFTCTYRRRAQLHRRLNKQHLLRRRERVQQLTAEKIQHSLGLQKGETAAFKGRGLRERPVPTKRQLDAQLDEYMSMSKSRLDKELDDYMSMSRSRLDAQLDDYMLMAGQMDLQWGSGGVSGGEEPLT